METFAALVSVLLLAASPAQLRLPIPWAGMELVVQDGRPPRATAIAPGGVAAAAGIVEGAEVIGRVSRDGRSQPLATLDLPNLASALTCLPAAGLTLRLSVAGAPAKDVALACEPVDPPAHFRPGRPPRNATPEKLAAFEQREAKRLAQARKLARAMPITPEVPLLADEASLSHGGVELLVKRDGTLAGRGHRLEGDKLLLPLQAAGRCTGGAKVTGLRVSGGLLGKPVELDVAKLVERGYAELEVPVARLAELTAGCTPLRTILELKPLRAVVSCGVGRQATKELAPSVWRACAMTLPARGTARAFGPAAPSIATAAGPGADDGLLKVWLPESFHVGRYGPAELVALDTGGKVMRVLGTSKLYGDLYARVKMGPGGLIVALRLTHADGAVELSAPAYVHPWHRSDDPARDLAAMKEAQLQDDARVALQLRLIEQGCEAGKPVALPLVRCPAGATAAERRAALAATKVAPTQDEEEPLLDEDGFVRE